ENEGEGGLMGLLGSDDELLPGDASDEGTTRRPEGDDGEAVMVEDDASFGDILDEFASDDDLSDVLENALEELDGRQASGDGGDDGGSDREADDSRPAGDEASTAAVADKAGDKASANESSSGKASDHAAFDADAMSAQNDMLQQIIDAGKQGGDAL